MNNPNAKIQSFGDVAAGGGKSVIFSKLPATESTSSTNSSTDAKYAFNAAGDLSSKKFNVQMISSGGGHLSKIVILHFH